MIHKALVMLSLIALSCSFLLAMNACSISDTEDKSAEELIDESNGVVSGFTDTRFPTTPQEARAIELGSGEKTSTKLSSTDATGPKEARAASMASSEVQLSTPSSNTSASQTSDMDPSGAWTMSLDDGTSLKLTLYQNAGVVFGTGSLSEGNATIQISASGSLAGDKLKLDVVSFGSINLYKLTITPKGASATGSYTAYPISGNPVSGSLSGTKSA
jgi:hypothetical protein